MFFSKMSISASGAFCRRMGIGLRAGVNVLKLLESEAKFGGTRQRLAVETMLDEVKSGFTISEAMQKQSPFFPRLMVALTRVGEATGKMEKTFLTLADHYEHQTSLRRQFYMSIAWPAMQLTIGLFVISLVIYLMGILQPAGGGQMEDMLGFGLRGGSGVMVFWGYVLCVATLIAALIFGYRRNLGGVQNLIPVLYLIPRLGPALQTITLSRFTRVLAIALSSGLDPIRSVKLALASTDSDFYLSGAATVETAILEQGETLAGALRATDLFPDVFMQLVEVSELSGTESESIEHLADEYEERSKMAMRTLSGVATGVVWVAVAGTLVFMILRMATKIFGGYGTALDGI